jgi:dTDP-4-dehydrorhamnose reductase
VTGATGLLGRQVMKVLLDSPWEVLGLGRSRAKPPIISCDLIPSGAALKQIQGFQPSVVIHLAERRQEVLAPKKNMETQLLNVDTTGAIAGACDRCGAWLIYVSTDQVFDGTSPPYGTDAEPNPITEYGRQKRRAERLLLETSPRAAVLRVPQIFGSVEYLQESALSALYAELRSGTVPNADDWQLHYPTWAPDVAEALKAMVDRHNRGTELRGLYHWQSNEQFTKFQMVHAIAEVAGLDTSRVVPVKNPLATPQRLHDIKLDGSRLADALSSHGRFCRPFRTGLQICLAPFLEAASR